MSEAAYEQAKAEGSLIQQRLRNLVEQGLLIEPEELFVLAEAADSIDWHSKERDSLIAENEKLKRLEKVVSDYIEASGYTCLADPAICAAVFRNALHGFDHTECKQHNSMLPQYCDGSVIDGECEMHRIPI